MKNELRILSIILILFIVGCSGGSDSHYCENKIISHEHRDSNREIATSINECQYLETSLRFQVCDANLQQLCGNFYSENDFGEFGPPAFECYDLQPSSVGFTLFWPGYDTPFPGYSRCNPPNPPCCFLPMDTWADLWLVYGDGQVSPVYTVFIDVE